MADVNLDEALTKFSVGDSITDDELRALINFFDKMDSGLAALCHHYNGGFGLARREAQRGLQTLEGFQHARNRDK